ncbi:carbohydrate ABC transporter permease [Alicyclobacillus kakegawensis]|uniref:carbohydrate ABC transporter permease n=1 Tax=Alicyclobacillus kakegawensis TaxID=392012 RepID=UPI00082A7A89|nr:carbohydrate ABC transporter permease [Alicyclobacillus kakegawensis]
MKRKSQLQTLTRAFFLTLYTLFVVVPLYEMVKSSFEPLRDIESTQFHFLPLHFSWKAYRDMWTTLPLARYFIDSLVVSGISTLLSIVVAICAAYAFSRFRFPGKSFFGVMILATQIFPGMLFLLPIFVMFTQIQDNTGIQLNGTYLGLVITYMTFALPFAIWMMRGYFETIPLSLEEAAMIDGCSRIGVLTRIVIPLAIPGIIAVAVFAFLNAWNEVLFASVLTSDTTQTLAIGLQSYATQTVVEWNQLMASSITVTVPVMVAFLLVQKYFLFGLTGGVKE